VYLVNLQTMFWSCYTPRIELLTMSSLSLFLYLMIKACDPALFSGGFNHVGILQCFGISYYTLQ